MPLTAQELTTASACLDSCISDGQKQSIIIYLLATIAGVPTDAQSLVTAAACLDSCIPAGMRESVIISLLDTIATAPAAVSDQVQCGATDPVAPPTGSCSLYFQTVSQALYAWDGSAWVLKA